MIVFVNGASCTGKTSLARALQAQWPTSRQSPLLYWSLDSVIGQLPFHLTGDKATSDDGFSLKTNERGSEVGVGSLGRRLNALSARYVQQLASGGLDVVVDYVLLNEEMLDDFRVALTQVPVLFVGLFCSADILSVRNAERVDRASKLAVCQQETVHFCRAMYDLELDSTRQCSDALAAQIVEFLSTTPIASGLGPSRAGE